MFFNLKNREEKNHILPCPVPFPEPLPLSVPFTFATLIPSFAQSDPMVPIKTIQQRRIKSYILSRIIH